MPEWAFSFLQTSFCVFLLRKSKFHLKVFAYSCICCIIILSNGFSFASVISYGIRNRIDCKEVNQRDCIQEKAR